MRIRIVTAAAAALIASAATPAPAQDAGAMARRWAEAFNAGDLARSLALYHENSTFVGLRSREVGGSREAVQAYLSGVFDTSSTRNVNCEGAMTRARGDAFVVAGLCQFSIAFKNGTQLVGPVRYHMVVQRGGNDWLITDHHLSLVPAP